MIQERIPVTEPFPQTPQALFDRVAAHLHRQNEKCQSGTGACFYRHPEKPLMCAIGACIPDNVYRKEGMDEILSSQTSTTAPEVMKTFRNELGLTDLDDSKFEHLAEVATSLQAVHDFHELFNWPRELRGVAQTFDLNSSIVDTLWGK